MTAMELMMRFGIFSGCMMVGIGGAIAGQGGDWLGVALGFFMIFVGAVTVAVNVQTDQRGLLK